MADKIPCVVIGGGVVGLAVAKALVAAGLGPLLVLERHHAIGMENSSRNSEVLHAGLYYKPGSLKAHLCVKGRDLMLDYIKQRKIAYRQCGKLVVAAEPEIPTLHNIYNNGTSNGLKELQMLDRAAARELEPQVECAAALWSPFTSIFDSHALMLNYEADIEGGAGYATVSSSGSQVVLNCTVHSITVNNDTGVSICGESETGTGKGRFLLETSQGALACNYLVNAAGLAAQHVAASIRFCSSPSSVNQQQLKQQSSMTKTEKVTASSARTDGFRGSRSDCVKGVEGEGGSSGQMALRRSIPPCYYAKGSYFRLQRIPPETSASKPTTSNTATSNCGTSNAATSKPTTSNTATSNGSGTSNTASIAASGGFGVHAEPAAAQVGRSQGPFQRLVYPVPQVGGLGVHATIDLSGSTRFGPDVQWLSTTRATGSGPAGLVEGTGDTCCGDPYLHPIEGGASAASAPALDFTVEGSISSSRTASSPICPGEVEHALQQKVRRFREEIARYWPGILGYDYELVPDYAGIRPKLIGPRTTVTVGRSGESDGSGGAKDKDAFSDFAVHGAEAHGVPGLVCLYGIESPGLTCSLALGEHVRQLLQRDCSY